MLRSHLYEPGLNCQNCNKLLREAGKKPACFYNRCDIVDLMSAPDSRKLHAMLSAFLEVEYLQNTKGFDAMIERIVNENGLNNLTPSTLMKLKSVIHEHRKFVAESRSK